MKYGRLSENDALAMVTLNPAKQLRVDKWVGSIDAGKDADLAIYDKYPLSASAKVLKVLIDGTVYFDRDKALADNLKAQQDRQKLIEKEKQNQTRQQPARRPTV
jgi:adenine deaminase